MYKIEVPSTVHGHSKPILGWRDASCLPSAKLFTLQAQVFNLANHANYYVQNGTGVVATQYSATAFGDNPDGSTNCGDGSHLNQHCYLIPGQGFGALQVINALNGPRVVQFAIRYSF